MLFIYLLSIFFIVGGYIFLSWKDEQQPKVNFTVWLFLTVIVSLAPLGFNASTIIFSGAAFSLERIWAQGEIFLVCVAICSSSVGALIVDNIIEGDLSQTPKLVLMLAAFLLISAAIFLFAAIPKNSEEIYRGTTPLSLSTLSTTVIISGCCILLTGWRQN